MTGNGTAAQDRASRGKRRILLIAILILLMLDFAPYTAGPNFRYTGSDPERAVINFGFPLASFIFDGEAAPHFFVSPFLYLVLLVQMAALTCLFILLYTVIPALRKESE